MTKISKAIITGVLFFSAVYADEYSFSGYGSTGYIFYDRSIIKGNKEESFYEGKLQMDLKLNKELEAQLDFRAQSDEHAVELREFSVKFEYVDYIKFKFGHIKLPFGAEQIENRENLATFDRSIGHNRYSELGFGGRSVALQAYYNYSDKRENFPYSYFLNLYRNNGLSSGVALRGAYHFANFIFGSSYLYQHRGGRNPVDSNAGGADITFEGKNATLSIEGAFFRDPVVSIQNIIFNDELQQQAADGDLKSEEVYSAAIRLTAAYKFSTDADVIKDIEPVYMFSSYYPDTDDFGSHEMQNLLGVNLYFSKQVRLRVQADLRTTKSAFSDAYTTLGSRGIFDLQIRF